MRLLLAASAVLQAFASDVGMNLPCNKELDGLLAADPSGNPSSFLSCVGVGVGNIGFWERKVCPNEMVFDFINQQCKAKRKKARKQQTLNIAILNNSCANGETCIGGTVCDLDTLRCLCPYGTMPQIESLSCVKIEQNYGQTPAFSFNSFNFENLRTGPNIDATDFFQPNPNYKTVNSYQNKPGYSTGSSQWQPFNGQQTGFGAPSGGVPGGDFMPNHQFVFNNLFSTTPSPPSSISTVAPRPKVPVLAAPGQSCKNLEVCSGGSICTLPIGLCLCPGDLEARDGECVLPATASIRISKVGIGALCSDLAECDHGSSCIMGRCACASPLIQHDGKCVIRQERQEVGPGELCDNGEVCSKGSVCDSTIPVCVCPADTDLQEGECRRVASATLPPATPATQPPTTQPAPTYVPPTFAPQPANVYRPQPPTTVHTQKPTTTVNYQNIVTTRRPTIKPNHMKINLGGSKQAGVGVRCALNTDCMIGAYCNGNTNPPSCQCLSTHVNIEGRCEKIVYPGQIGCRSDLQCSAAYTGTSCIDRVCVCPDGSRSVDQTCVPVTSSTPADGEKFCNPACLPPLSCIHGVCVHPSVRRVREASVLICWPGSKMCSNGDGVCLEGECRCLRGWQPRDGACRPIEVAIGAACDSAATVCQKGAVCDAGGVGDVDILEVVHPVEETEHNNRLVQAIRIASNITNAAQGDVFVQMSACSVSLSVVYKTLHSGCTGSDRCAGGSLCKDGVCQCTDGSSEHHGRCQQSPGGRCTSGQTCRGGSLCEFGICRCPDGTTVTSNSTCQPAVSLPGGSCQLGQKCAQGSACRFGICMCLDKTIVVNGKCAKRTNLILQATETIPGTVKGPGMECKGKDLCSGGSRCTDGFCVCEDHEVIIDDQCVGSREEALSVINRLDVSAPGQPCDARTNCTGGSLCIDKVCRCEGGNLGEEGTCRTQVPGAAMSPPKREQQESGPGSQCTISRECPFRTECVRGVCRCKKGETIIDDTCRSAIHQVLPGGKCDPKNGYDCVGESRCVYGVCNCLRQLINNGNECVTAQEITIVAIGKPCTPQLRCAGGSKCVDYVCRCSQDEVPDVNGKCAKKANVYAVFNKFTGSTTTQASSSDDRFNNKIDEIEELELEIKSAGTTLGEVVTNTGVPSQVLYGTSCRSDVECPSKATCLQGFCHCLDGFRATAGYCERVAKAGDACQSTNQCESNAFCLQGKCVCTSRDGRSCSSPDLRRPGEECGDGRICAFNSYCGIMSGVCECPSGMATVDTACRQTANKPGMACVTSRNCHKYSYCDNGYCLCKSGFYLEEGFCVPADPEAAMPPNRNDGPQAPMQERIRTESFLNLNPGTVIGTGFGNFGPVHSGASTSIAGNQHTNFGVGNGSPGSFGTTVSDGSGSNGGSSFSNPNFFTQGVGSGGTGTVFGSGNFGGFPSSESNSGSGTKAENFGFGMSSVSTSGNNVGGFSQTQTGFVGLGSSSGSSSSTGFGFSSPNIGTHPSFNSFSSFTPPSSSYGSTFTTSKLYIPPQTQENLKIVFPQGFTAPSPGDLQPFVFQPFAHGSSSKSGDSLVNAVSPPKLRVAMPGEYCADGSICLGNAVCTGQFCRCPNGSNAENGICTHRKRLYPGRPMLHNDVGNDEAGEERQFAAPLENCQNFEFCTAGSECLNIHGMGLICQCPVGQIFLDTECIDVPRNAELSGVGDPCSDGEICLGGSECIRDVCVCGEGKRDILGICVSTAQPGDDCSRGEVCVDGSHCVGEERTCVCPPGRKIQNGRCIEDENSPTKATANPGAPCNTHTICLDNSFCDGEGICKCLLKFRNVKGRCVPASMVRNAGERCPPASICAGGVCRNEICTCTEKQLEIEGNCLDVPARVARKEPSKQCDRDVDCPEKFVCVESLCIWEERQMDVSDCPHGCPEMSRCEEGICICDDGYRMEENICVERRIPMWKRMFGTTTASAVEEQLRPKTTEKLVPTSENSLKKMLEISKGKKSSEILKENSKTSSGSYEENSTPYNSKKPSWKSLEASLTSTTTKNNKETSNEMNAVSEPTWRKIFATTQASTTMFPWKSSTSVTIPWEQKEGGERTFPPMEKVPADIKTTTEALLTSLKVKVKVPFLKTTVRPVTKKRPPSSIPPVAVSPGASCLGKRKCGDGGVCLDGYCICSYEDMPLNDACLPKDGLIKLGHRCSAVHRCSDGLVCLLNKCSCAFGNKNCNPNEPVTSPPGGSCTEARECTGGSVCREGWCICPDPSMIVQRGICIQSGPRPTLPSRTVPVYTTQPPPVYQTNPPVFHQTAASSAQPVNAYNSLPQPQQQSRKITPGAQCGPLDSCVGGSTCVEGLCVCPAGTQPSLHGRCEFASTTTAPAPASWATRRPVDFIELPPIGSTHAQSQQTTTTNEYVVDNSECEAIGLFCRGNTVCINRSCQCPEGYVLHNDGCVPPTETGRRKIRGKARHQVAASQYSRPGEDCASGQVCTGGATCDDSQTCSCPPEKPEIKNDYCHPVSSRRQAVAGESCDENTDCSNNSTCHSGQCRCPPQFIAISGHCVAMPMPTTPQMKIVAKPLESCDGGEVCEGGASCDEDTGICMCPSGQIVFGDQCQVPPTVAATTKQTTAPAITAECSTDAQCSGGRTCMGNKCRCKPGTVDHAGVCELLEEIEVAERPVPISYARHRALTETRSNATESTSEGEGVQMSETQRPRIVGPKIRRPKPKPKTGGGSSSGSSGSSGASYKTGGTGSGNCPPGNEPTRDDGGRLITCNGLEPNCPPRSYCYITSGGFATEEYNCCKSCLVRRKPLKYGQPCNKALDRCTNGASCIDDVCKCTVGFALSPNGWCERFNFLPQSKPKTSFSALPSTETAPAVESAFPARPAWNFTPQTARTQWPNLPVPTLAPPTVTLSQETRPSSQPTTVATTSQKPLVQVLPSEKGQPRIRGRPAGASCRETDICLHGSSCISGRCQCGAPLVARNGHCVRLNLANPGESCEMGEQCVGGSVCDSDSYRCICASKHEIIDGVCRSKDSAHFVVPGHTCASGQICSGGSTCVAGTCHCDSEHYSEDGYCRHISFQSSQISHDIGGPLRFSGQLSPRKPVGTCEPENCRLPNCFCSLTGREPPLAAPLPDIPQFVVLTFDDAVNGRTLPDYLTLFSESKYSNPNGCPVKATFFVSHEWTNYDAVQWLHEQGMEIASNSISHVNMAGENASRWLNEMDGQRRILAKFGNVPEEKIVGMRAPQLAAGGNAHFEMMAKAGFIYDNTLSANPGIHGEPFWPQTLDYAVPWNCHEENCPTSSFPGLWEIPLNQFYGSYMPQIDGYRRSSMIRAAVDLNNTVLELTNMLLTNFDRAYTSNKAPFVLSLNADFLQLNGRNEGMHALQKFLDEITENKDVFLVTLNQLIQWMQNPLPMTQIHKSEALRCNRLQFNSQPRTTCSQANKCMYRTPWMSSYEHQMKTCAPCPDVFPWIQNPTGNIH